MFTPEEIAILEKNRIYQKYKNTAYSSVTTANVIADLDALPGVGLENQLLIAYLSWLFKMKATEDLEGDMSVVRTNYLLPMYRQMSAMFGGTAASHMHDETHYIEVVAVTLSSGTTSNTQLLAADSNEKYGIPWIALSWDTAPGNQYFIDLHEADGSTIVDVSFDSVYAGQRAWVFADTATVNKAVQGSFSGGSGAENLFCVLSYCKW